MRKSLLVICIILQQVSMLRANDTKLLRMLKQKDFPGMEKLLMSTSLDNREKQLYNVFLLNAHGKAAASNEFIAQVRRKGQIKTGDSLDFYLHITACDNYVKLFDYRKAAAESQLLLKDYAAFYSEKDLEDEKQAASIWTALSEEKPQELVKKSLSVLAFNKDIAGLWRIPVGMGDTTVKFIFDTGAGLSTIGKTMAEKMKLRFIENAAIDIKSGVTGIATKVQLAIAPRLALGPDIVAHNVVFLVFPDEALSFANGAYVIEGIIGLPVIKELGEFTIQDGEIVIPEKPGEKKVQHNMILDLLKPVIYMQYNNVLLPFTFDSGANTSSFSDNFYHAYQKEIEAAATKKNVSVGGTGGVISKEVLIMPQLKMQVQDKTAVFTNAEINTDEISTNGKTYYGNIGQDLIGQFTKMTVSFTGSYILFE